MSALTPYYQNDRTSVSRTSARLLEGNTALSQNTDIGYLQDYIDQKDAYILQPILLLTSAVPTGEARYKPIRPRTTVCLGLQKYHYDEQSNQFDSVFSAPIKLCLHVVRFFDRRDDNYILPYQLDAYLLNAHEIANRHCGDPVLGILQQSYRLVFRYDPQRSIGCLVHFGQDLTPYDQAQMSLLWLTAVNRDRSELEQHRKASSQTIGILSSTPRNHALL